jgi:hypothetical protein
MSNQNEQVKKPREFWIAIHQANLVNYKTKFSYSAFTDDRDNGPVFTNVHVLESAPVFEMLDKLEAALEFALSNYLDVPVEKKIPEGVLTTGRIIAKEALTELRNWRLKL